MAQSSRVEFSIITVCFNEEDAIRKTIESVLKQTYLNYEYIVCDGGSTDDTLKIVESYRNEFEKKGIRFIVHTEKDGGIYYGMNNGVRRSNGAYLNFLNAGDQFHNDEVLYKISHRIRKHDIDILYGDIVKIERGYGKKQIGSLQTIEKGMSICHQAMFVKAELMKDHPYDTHYKIVADYEFTLSMWKQRKKFVHIDEIVVNFRAGGVSTTQVEKIAKEYCEVQEKEGIAFDYQSKFSTTNRNLKKENIKNKIPFFIWQIYNHMRGRNKYE